jgi:hypothetical protein
MRNTQFNILSKPNTGSQTGPSQWMGQIVSASFVVTMGDTSAAGTVKIQASNDSPAGVTAPTQFTPTNWADIPNATSLIAAGVGPAILIPSMAFAYIRAVFTETTPGSTTINVQANVLGC